MKNQSNYQLENIYHNMSKLFFSIKVKDNIIPRKDMGDYKIIYESDFWKNLNLPPNSKFYKTSSQQLENLYGIPLETQFKVVK